MLLLICIIISSILGCHCTEVLVSSSGCGNTAQTAGSTTAKHKYEYIDHEYIIYLPTGYDGSTALPVIYMLPGYGMWPGYFEKHFGFQSQANENKYIFIITEGEQFESPVYENYWVRSWNDLSCSASPIGGKDTCDRESAITNWGGQPDTPTNCSDGGITINVTKYDNACNWCSCESDDIGYIKSLVTYIDNTYCIDTSREYLMGFSNGGMMAQRMACEAADIFAAITSFHGQMHNVSSLNCVPSNSMYTIPYMNVGNVKDSDVPILGGTDKYGWYYLSAQDVQNNLAQFNGCDISNGMSSITTVSDGILGWQCKTYDKQCRNGAKTQLCQWDTDQRPHDITCNNIKYVIDATWGPSDVRTCIKGEGNNFGLAAAWEFMKQFDNTHTTTTTIASDDTDAAVIINIGYGKIYYFSIVVITIICEIFY